jgi:hypothetical protein
LHYNALAAHLLKNNNLLLCIKKKVLTITFYQYYDWFKQINDGKNSNEQAINAVMNAANFFAQFAIQVHLAPKSGSVGKNQIETPLPVHQTK